MNYIEPYLMLASILFSFGIYAVITRKNAVAILMGIELILNSANINFITFNTFNPFGSSPKEYQFELTITDSYETTDLDTVEIVVYAEENIKPTASSPDLQINSPKLLLMI